MNSAARDVLVRSQGTHNVEVAKLESELKRERETLKEIGNIIFALSEDELAILKTMERSKVGARREDGVRIKLVRDPPKRRVESLQSELLMKAALEKFVLRSFLLTI